jgi:hypothetical protein
MEKGDHVLVRKSSLGLSPPDALLIEGQVLKTIPGAVLVEFLNSHVKDTLWLDETAIVAVNP